MKLSDHVKRILYASLGSMILAFGLFNVHAQSQISEGGILGLTLLLDQWFHISPAISSAFLNILCYLLAWSQMGNKFIFYSLISVLVYSGSYGIFESIGPLFSQIGNYPLLASILGAIFVGVGIGIAMRSGAAPGGDDALALVISHTCKIKVQWAYLLTDLIVLVFSLTYIPFKRIFYSLITVTISGQLIGLFMDSNQK